MSNPLPYPNAVKYIALCGNPLSGKSTAAELLAELAGYELADDGAPMRKMAMAHFGATWEDVYTQEGKKRKVVLNGVELEWRDVLGRLGNALEAQFGADIIPELAYNGLGDGRYVFGSVRREQGAYHRKRGAAVIEIVNPMAGPSPFEFDRYNPDHVQVRVLNDFLARGFSPDDARKALKERLAETLSLHTVTPALAA